MGTKDKRFLSISLAVAVILILGSLHAALPVSPASSPKLSTGLTHPTHLSHPMVPVASTASPSAQTLLSSSGCPLSAGQCFASLNWGGYAVCVPQADCSSLVAAPGTVTDVKGSWVVPAIQGGQGYQGGQDAGYGQGGQGGYGFGQTCSDSQKTWLDMSDWIGIDGFVSPSVEQTGTSSDCYYGQTYYYAWYEFYPLPSVLVSSLTVHPGDTISAEVSYSGGLFTTTITDVSTHQSFTSPATAVPGAETDSAEWIAESAYYDGFLALTPVNQVSFTGATATIGGVTNTIAGWAPNDYWLLMVDYNFGFNQELGVATPSTQTLAYAKAVPLPLGRSGDRFDVNWLSSGP